MGKVYYIFWLRYELYFFIVFMAISNGCCAVNEIIFYDPYYDKPNETNLIDSKEKYNLQFDNVVNSSPNSNLKNAILNKDFRFIGILGFAYLIPGIDEDKNSKLVEKYGFKVIAGTSDAIYSDYPPLESAAYEYAEKYNKSS